jgi:ATP/maltotriose-dependent transcriptional regulator MalT
VVAPAGYGKSTLLGLARRPDPQQGDDGVHVDSRISDPAVVWSGIIGTLAGMLPPGCQQLISSRHTFRLPVARLRATVRQIPHEIGVTWQTSKAWKASTDPVFTANDGDPVFLPT